MRDGQILLDESNHAALPEQPQGIIAGAQFHRRETKGTEMGAAGPFLGFTVMVLAALRRQSGGTSCARLLPYSASSLG